MIIETKNLVKIYGQRKVVNDVSLQVEQGTIVGLLGPKRPTIVPCSTNRLTSSTTLLCP